MHTPLKLGMVGGGSGAFIGAVHRTAACMDGHFRVVAGCLSSTAERAIASGKSLGLDDCRNYGTWQEMIDGERSLPAHERIDAVAIVTPNFTHAAIAAGFAGAGVNVVCDKPLCMNAAEADAILAAARAGNVVFGVTYTYAGYPMVKQARHLVASGVLGDIRKVVVEYHQGWLASKIEAEGQKQAAWRTDPALAGAGALGDIGSHCEQLITNITGLKIESLCADLSTFVPGRKVDDDVSVLLRLSSGARGIISASQVCEGEENNVSIRVYGSKGGLEWRQSDPNSLTLIEPSGRRSISRGHASLCDAAKKATRLPPGHPEGYIEAFANIYANIADAIRARAGVDAGAKFDFPDVHEGIRGVRFIEATLASAAGTAKWTQLKS